MKNVLLILALLCACQARAQVTMQFGGTPSGGCPQNGTWNDIIHGNLYWCASSGGPFTWTQVNGGGGGASLFTSFQFASNTPITTTGNYFHLTNGTGLSQSYSGAGTSGSPYVATLSLTIPVPYTSGGTNAITQAAAAVNIALDGSTAVGDSGYCSHVTTGLCDTFSIFAGNGTGTRVYSQNNSGAPGWLADSTTVNGQTCTLGSTCTVTGQTVYGETFTIGSGLTRYFGIAFSSAFSGTESQVMVVSDGTHTFSNFTCWASATTGGTTAALTTTFTMRKNGTTPSNAPNVSINSGSTSGGYSGSFYAQDSSDTMSVVVGDSWDVMIVTGGSIPTLYWNCSVRQQ
jgi:hypothetical protein